jgi:hypothetical protein
MQYERLAERAHQPPERMLAEHMQTIGDMDFLVTAVRRLLRTADAAMQIPSEHHHEQLKLAVKAFESRWWPRLKEIRDALEHVETPVAGFPVPAVGIPMSGNGDGKFIFMGPTGNLDLGKMYEAARAIAKAISSVVGP